MTEETADHIRQQMHALYSAEQPLGSLAESVFVRPGMYTINGTLEEAGAFLEGFYSGMLAHNREAYAKTQAQRWFDFCAWATPQVDPAATGGWFYLFRALRRKHHQDTAAFFDVLLLYRAFIQQNTPTVSE